MRFWDTSALIPLVVAESGSPRAERFLQEDRQVVVWTFTRVELLAAIARRRRSDPGAAARLREARRAILQAWEDWTEITAIEAVRRNAERVAETHALRAADALQIGAAVVAAGDRASALEFVTFDTEQATVAEREGFRVLTRA